MSFFTVQALSALSLYLPRKKQNVCQGLYAIRDVLGTAAQCTTSCKGFYVLHQFVADDEIVANDEDVGDAAEDEQYIAFLEVRSKFEPKRDDMEVLLEQMAEEDSHVKKSAAFPIAAHTGTQSVMVRLMKLRRRKKGGIRPEAFPSMIEAKAAAQDRSNALLRGPGFVYVWDFNVPGIFPYQKVGITAGDANTRMRRTVKITKAAAAGWAPTLRYTCWSPKPNGDSDAHAIEHRMHAWGKHLWLNKAAAKLLVKPVLRSGYTEFFQVPPGSSWQAKIQADALGKGIALKGAAYTINTVGHC